MRLFGLTISRARATKETPSSALAPAVGSGWWPLPWLREGFSGAWQRDIETPVGDVLAHHAVFACVTLIAGDIAKMGLGLVSTQPDGTKRPVLGPASKLLRTPNHYQGRIQFIMEWLLSKLSWGNTFVLKERDGRNGIRALYVLNPARVRTLVSPSGDVFYGLTGDALAGILDGVPAIPASEIIHDRMYPIYHPLVGLSPVHACGLAAVQGLRIQVNSAKFFQHGSNPGGILTAPGAISNETAGRLKEFWESKYAGAENAGKVAVLGDGLKFETMAINAVDSQLIEQLKFTAVQVCSAYHVPPHKIAAGDPPTHTNIEALDQAYYSSALQILIASIESLLADGLGIETPLGIEFNLDDLLRMDSATMIDAQAKAVGGGIASPNEARRKLNLPPVTGGDSPYLQQQNYSLAALDARDRNNPAPSTTTPPKA